MSAKGRLEREYLRSQHEGSPVSGTARLARGLLPKLLYAAILIALWQAAIVVLELKEFLVPSPLAVFNALFSPETAAQYQWWTHIATTLGEILAAFVFTAVFGFVLALLITWSDIVRGIAMPVIAVFNSLPKIALAPLFLIWFGYGFTANVTIAIPRGLLLKVAGWSTVKTILDPEPWFIGTIFGLLAFISYRAFMFRGEGYYLVSVVVYGGVALFSLVAVIGGWGNWLPGMRRQEPPAEASDGDDAGDRA